MNEIQVTAEISSSSREPSLWRFSLAEMMVFNALLAICFSMWAVDPLSSILLVFFLVPASIRTLAAKRLAQRKGMDLSLNQQVLKFLNSLVLIYAGCFLYGLVIAVVGAIVLILLAILSDWVLPYLSSLGVVLIDGVLWAGCALIFLFVQYRFLKATWPK